ncbi:MAG: AAA family ATPase, partial [Gammaproteobacteria bacterium]
MQEIYEKFEKFELVGSRALEIMREKSFSPQQAKTLRNWTLTEAAKMIQKSTKTIREHEKKSLLLPPNIINNKRQYSLHDINIIREHFKTIPTKNHKIPPAIIAFTNFKGGVAKTTGAIHAAQYFAKSGYKVLLIDADSQASIT